MLPKIFGLINIIFQLFAADFFGIFLVGQSVTPENKYLRAVNFYNTGRNDTPQQGPETERQSHPRCGDGDFALFFINNIAGNNPQRLNRTHQLKINAVKRYLIIGIFVIERPDNIRLQKRQRNRTAVQLPDKQQQTDQQHNAGEICYLMQGIIAVTQLFHCLAAIVKYRGNYDTRKGRNDRHRGK